MNNNIPKVLLFFSFFILISKLFYLSILKSKKYKLFSQKNQFKIMEIPGLRGRIFDRNGKILAGWKRGYRIIPVEKNKNIYKELKKIFGEFNSKNYFIEDTSIQRLIELKTSKVSEDVLIEFTGLRFYPYAEISSHIVGYIGEISQKELKIFKNYELGDKIGKYGLEKFFEKKLREKKGEKLILTNAYGHLIPEYSRIIKLPQKGEDIYITIDINLQQFIDSLFENYQSGACVVYNIQNGEVFALYSKPSFNPNKLTWKLSKNEWQKLIQDTLSPLLNRAISGLYPPGSIFKLITAGIALDNQIINKNSTFSPCKGKFLYGNKIFKCWKEEGHGKLDLKQAIVQSCDIYFYQLGLKIGLKKFLKEVKKLNLTQKTGIELKDEKEGFIPDFNWYKKKYKWVSPGYVINLSIGQGEILLTPIQIALMTARIILDSVPKPHLLLKNFKKQYIKGIFSKDTKEFLKEAMIEVIENPKGTGILAKIDGIKIGGKTGTAQNPKGEDHALFTCFFPADNPQFVVTVVVEYSGHGGNIAAPLAKKIVEWLIKNNYVELTNTTFNNKFFKHN